MRRAGAPLGLLSPRGHGGCLDGAFLGKGEGPSGGFSPPGKNSFFVFREVEIRSRWAGTEAFLTQDGQAAFLRAPAAGDGQARRGSTAGRAFDGGGLKTTRVVCL